MTEKIHIPEVIEPDEKLPADLAALRHFAWILDSAFRVPGTKKRVGLDAGLGLIPYAGDIVGGLLSAWVVVGALKHRVPMRVIGRMVMNVLIDVGVGAIPIIGDIIDLFFKENLKNVDLLVMHRDRRNPPRAGREIALFAATIIGFILVFAAVLFTASAAAIIWLVTRMMGN